MSSFPEELVHGSGIVLTLEPQLAVASLRPQPGLPAGASPTDLLVAAGLTPVDTSGGAAAESSRQGTNIVNDTDRIRWVRVSADQSLPAAEANAQDQLGEQLEWLAPVYRFPDVEGDAGLVCCLPNSLLIKPTDGAHEEDLEQFAAELGLVEDQERSRYTTPFRYFRVGTPTEQNAYELRDELMSRANLISEVRLETMPMLVPITTTVNDPLLSEQWGVQQIHAPDAWDVTSGSDHTVICILDEGCDLSHPDLRFSEAGINLGTMQPDGRPTGNHGTACGGIAAAVTNNNTGVAGIAGNSPILPLAFSSWTDVECAAGIRYAADHGAAVISMSFGVYGPGEGQGPVGWDFAIIDPAITYAHGRDVVMCAATGNENISSHNRFPSRHPLVLACGASDEADNRKSPTSPDGETWWGSNFAPGVSLVAPGVHISTTDRQGADGYNKQAGTAGNYYASFNGTSSATPHVAGVIALMRACNPALSASETVELLLQSTDKVGTQPYAPQPGFPLGSRNNEMGYGRLNAAAAVHLANEARLRAYSLACAPTTHDLTGDGTADVVGFGNAGVWVSLNNGDGTFQVAKKVVDNFGYEVGNWRVERHPRFLADVTGDGTADVVGFGNAGVWVSLNNGDGTFQVAKKVVDNFGYEVGNWRVERHPRFLADVTGDGTADVVGFGNAGVWVSLNNGDGTFQVAKKVVDNFGYEVGNWRVERHPRFLADVTGDGTADVVGFGNAGVWVSLNNGDGTFQVAKKVVDNFGYEVGNWRVERHPRFLADVTGDGTADVVGFGNAGVWVSLNNGDGTFQVAKKVVDNFGYEVGNWRVERHPRFLADVTGDGTADVVGFGNAGVWVSLNNGDGTFQVAKKVVDNFGYEVGNWRVERHPRFLADVTGDGTADTAGFGNAGVWVSLNNGDGTFQVAKKVVDNFGYEVGNWRVGRHPRIMSGPGSIGS